MVPAVSIHVSEKVPTENLISFCESIQRKRKTPKQVTNKPGLGCSQGSFFFSFFVNQHLKQQSGTTFIQDFRKYT